MRHNHELLREVRSFLVDSKFKQMTDTVRSQVSSSKVLSQCDRIYFPLIHNL